MPITSVTKDPEALTMTVIADFAATQQRLWDAYADPRQIEQFWGPPTYPAKFTRHDMAVGGRTDYVMTGPDGDKAPGHWNFLAVDAPNSFEVEDGFSNEDGSDNTDMPTMRMTFTFESTDGGSRLTTVTHFNSAEQLEQLIAMGMEQGMTEAMGQIDDVLADLASFAAGRGTNADILSDTQVRVTRVIRGSKEQVWEAHNNAELMQQWLLGPDGWTMPVCEIATKVGDTYRYEWEPEGGGEGAFGFDGELLESNAPHRSVTTEHMIDTDYPSTLNEMTLTSVEGGTLLSLVITYPSAEVRDMVLATGMTDGMETSYARLESVVAGQ
ncbi:SRPBCC family protein [Demequina aurantiaca]|uniref:SRPBCC family protein n=1 Tax=Demequina aurantiaca TaxID=676200 RepID=UPI0007843965|nr:SRPBCC family protein [Demequina aurantiaca]